MEAKHVSRNDKENILIQERLNKIAQRKDIIQQGIPFLGMIVVVVALGIATSGNLFSSVNLVNLLNQSLVLIIVAVGASFVYAHGGVDFTVGSAMGVSEFVIVYLLLNTGLPLFLALLLGIGVTILTSVSVALCAEKLKIPVFVGSLGLRMILLGILNMLTTSGSDTQLNLPYGSYSYMNSDLLKVITLIALIAVGYYLFEYTTIGKRLKIIGGNRTVAKESGINVTKYVIIAYVILGVCVGIAGIFSLFRASGVTNTSGSGTEFDLMTCIALGGFPLKGGQRSRMINAIIGAITVSVLSNGLLLCRLDATIINGVKGLLFILIVGLSYDRSAGKLVS